MPKNLEKILIVDDDIALSETLANSFQKRGFETFIANDVQSALVIAKEQMPDFATVDLRLGEGNGLICVEKLIEINPLIRIVVLTGYASIATAVEAIKLGACHYLAKPSNSNEILAAFGKVKGTSDVQITQRTSSIKTLEWERIQETLVETNYNISEAARRLGMHRRTLARKLQKQPVK
jgi:two-component system, response regulator RegA